MLEKLNYPKTPLGHNFFVPCMGYATFCKSSMGQGLLGKPLIVVDWRSLIIYMGVLGKKLSG